MAYGSVDITIGVSVLLAVVSISMIIRLVARLGLQQNFSWDDLLAVFGTALYMALAVFYLITLREYAIGKHTWELTHDQYSTHLKTGYVSVALWLPATYIMKLSFIGTLLRIVQTRPYKWSLYILAVTGGVLTLFVELWFIFFCHPVQLFWQIAYHPERATSCRSFTSLKTSLLVQAAWILIADITLGLIIPILVLRGLQMRLKMKISICLIIAIGSLSSIATIMRMIYVPGVNGTDTVYSANAAVFWANVEVATNIICTAATTWKPIIIKIGAMRPSSFKMRRKGAIFGHVSRRDPESKIEGTSVGSETQWPSNYSWREDDHMNSSSEFGLIDRHQHHRLGKTEAHESTFV